MLGVELNIKKKEDEQLAILTNGDNINDMYICILSKLSLTIYNFEGNIIKEIPLKNNYRFVLCKNNLIILNYDCELALLYLWRILILIK